MSHQPFKFSVALSLLVAIGLGCAGDGPTVSLKSDDVAGRIPAMKQAAARKDTKAVPELVTLLESDDPAERFYAIEALRRITGQTMGYHYYGSDRARADSVARWKRWLETGSAEPVGESAGVSATQPAPETRPN